MIDSVSDINTQYNDLNLPATGTKVRYIIEVVPVSVCVATRAKNYNTSRSNPSTTKTVGMYELTNNPFPLNVFPNPNTGLFTLDMKLNAPTGVSIDLHRIDGKLILAEQITAKGNFEKQIDLSDHPKGIYYLQVVTERGVATKKVVYQ